MSNHHKIISNNYVSVNDVDVEKLVDYILKNHRDEFEEAYGMDKYSFQDLRECKTLAAVEAVTGDDIQGVWQRVLASIVPSALLLLKKPMPKLGDISSHRLPKPKYAV